LLRPWLPSLSPSSSSWDRGSSRHLTTHARPFPPMVARRPKPALRPPEATQSGRNADTGQEDTSGVEYGILIAAAAVAIVAVAYVLAGWQTHQEDMRRHQPRPF